MSNPNPGTAPPPYLYKYRSLATHEQRAFLWDILESRRLYWPTPHQLNDPFDLMPSFVYAGSRPRLAMRARALADKFEPTMSRADRRRIAEAAARRDPAEVTAAMNIAQLQLRKQIGVLSLSARYDHPMMWAHYADSHKGVCLRFATYSDYFAHFILALPVQYQEHRPTLNVAVGVAGEEALKQVLLCKADFWAYEEEWRMIDQTGFGHRDFPRGALCAIILGTGIDPKEEDLLRSWSDGSPLRPPVLRARPHDCEFRMVVPGL